MAISSISACSPKLHRTQRQRGKDAIQRNWAEFLKHTDHDEHNQALEVQIPLGRENYCPRLVSGNRDGSA